MIIVTINNDLTATVGTASVPFEFIYDSSTGKYGYKDGADTFRPFNDGEGGGYEPDPVSIFIHDYQGSYTSTYTVTTAGIYVAIVQTNGTDTNSRSITTTGTVLLTKGTSTGKSALIKVIDCKVRNTITIYGNGAGGYPYNTNILTRIVKPSA